MRIGFCCDGAKLKGYGCVGGVVSVYWSVPDFVDRFGNVQYKTICMRFKLPLVRTPDKIVRALKKCNGDEFPPQAAYAVAKVLYAGNMAVSLLKCRICGSCVLMVQVRTREHLVALLRRLGIIYVG